MDNQASSPQIIFPNVPDDFCPAGNWTQILQEFIDEVLANGTINVPGLGDVTPQEIQNINDQLTALQNQIDALSQVQIKRGSVTGLLTGDNIVPVSFSSAFPDSQYAVALTPLIATNTVSALPTFLLQTGSKTSSGFSIVVENNIAAITEVEWVAIRSI
jgi:hypothetical protein